MSVPWWTWALLAVLFFWMLGAHNRVVALRNGLVTAWGQVEPVLQARLQALTALRSTIEPRLPAEGAALEAVAAAQAQLLQAMDALRQRPADAAAAQALQRAEAALAPAQVRLAALVEQLTGWREDPALAGPLRTLRELAPRWQFVRQNYNDAVVTYNAAVRQFPTRLLTRLFRFAPADRL